jgi:hypothetical protein
MYFPLALKVTIPSTDVCTEIEIGMPLKAVLPPPNRAGSVIVDDVVTPKKLSLHAPLQLVEKGAYRQIL